MFNLKDLTPLETETLINKYQKNLKRLDKIIAQSDKQQLQLLKLNEELDEHKKNLEIRVVEEIKKRQEKEKILIQQSKLASMGEMMDAVAHQWKQPINAISMQVELMADDFDEKLVDRKYINEFQEDVYTQINHMLHTLSEFRTFFRPAKNLMDFDVSNMLQKVLLLVKDEFMQHTIEIIIEDTQSFTLNGIENEFKHLIINLINNSKDAFLDNKIDKRKIWINTFLSKEYKSIEVIDNAGGIPVDVIDDIFKANVTTKVEREGTGIGLYMSSQIAHKHNGTLVAENVNDGAKFTFMYKK